MKVIVLFFAAILRLLTVMSSSSLPTTGASETALLTAFLERTATGEAAVLPLLRQGVECRSESTLPGTNNFPPDSCDLDGFAMLLSHSNFEAHVPEVFNITVGGYSMPESSKGIESSHGYRYVGSANCNIHIHVPVKVYDKLMWELRACQPGSKGAPSRTNRKTYPMDTFLAALRSSNSTFIIINCYGLEDEIQFSTSADGTTEVKLKPSMRYIEQLADSSEGFRSDVAALWLCDGATPYLSVPGSPSGVQVFPIGVPLQSATHFMRYMGKHLTSSSSNSSSASSSPPPTADPTADQRAAEYSGGGWRGGTITAHATFLRSKQGASTEFDITDASSGRYNR
jgi:hypothetical protein